MCLLGSKMCLLGGKTRTSDVPARGVLNNHTWLADEIGLLFVAILSANAAAMCVAAMLARQNFRRRLCPFGPPLRPYSP
eukprot:222991-Chlamydomonas_euryale.AAC.4